MQGFHVHWNFGGSGFHQSTLFHLVFAKNRQKKQSVHSMTALKIQIKGKRWPPEMKCFKKAPPAFLLRRFSPQLVVKTPQMFWTESRLILCKQLNSTSQNASSCVNYVEPHNLWVCFDAAFKLLQSSPLCCVHGTLRHSVVVQCSTHNTGCSQCCLFIQGNWKCVTGLFDNSKPLLTSLPTGSCGSESVEEPQANLKNQTIIT